MGKKKLSGYFTVEATFLVPIFVCVLALLCYLGMFLSNRCMLLQDVYRLGVKGSTAYGMNNTETVSYVLNESENLLSKYYGISQIDKKAEADLFTVSIEFQSEMKVPFAFYSWEKDKMSGIWDLKESRQLDRTKPVDFIRAVRKVEKLFD